MKVFYHNDNDGKCAAHLVDRFYNLDPPDHCSQLLIHYIPMDYGKEFPLDTVYLDEQIYILDFSIERKEMLELLEITTKVVWIDHHKTAIDKYSGFEDHIGYPIMGIREIGKSGCELTWEFLFIDQPMPLYVNLIGDRDTWRWEHGDRSKFFHYGIIAGDNDPCDSVWLEAIDDTNSIIEKGKAVFGYVRKQNIEAIKERGYWIDFHGYDTYAINSDIVRGSEFFEEAVPEADMWLVYRYVPKNNQTSFDGYWTIGIYSTMVDVSQIANQYEYEGKRGGGHKGASGFQCYDLSFLTD